MRRIFENGVCLQPLQKITRWPDGLLLLVKCWTSPSKEGEEEEKEKTVWPSGDFLIQYFRNIFTCQWACCSSTLHINTCIM